jgi:hypothetical protein
LKGYWKEDPNMSEKTPRTDMGGGAEKSHVSTRERKKVNPLVIEIIAVVLILLLGATVAYMMSPSKEKGLSVIIHPSGGPGPIRVILIPGENVTLTVKATWNGDDITDSENLTIEWTVDNATLGTLIPTGEASTVFTAAHVNMSGVITCNVTYVIDGENHNSQVIVNITVTPSPLVYFAITPDSRVLLLNRPQVFMVEARDSFGYPVSCDDVSWTVEGIPAANYSLNRTIGSDVELSVNVTGSGTLVASLIYDNMTWNTTATIGAIEDYPRMILSRAHITDGRMFTCSEPTLPLPWGYVEVHLTDGVDTVNWTLSTSDLNNGSYSIHDYGSKTLGTLVVSLKVIDMTGNGAANASDVLTVTTTNGKFNPAKSYMLTLIYVPTMDIIVSETFAG